jgi:hypothetical protein
MQQVLSSPEFWFGLVVLSIYQVGKFNELNSLDRSVSRRSTIIPNLGAKDFVGPRIYIGLLAAFIVSTFLLYFGLCLVSPTLLRGWARVNQYQGVEEFVSGTPYPLYIAAALMGTQAAIPGLSKIGNAQRDLFHYWVGVPRKVVEASQDFFNQILNRCETRQSLEQELMKLTGHKWQQTIDEYADIVFYREELDRLKLSDSNELKDVLAGSDREIRNLIEQLVYASSIAAARSSGGRALSWLAQDLRLQPPIDRGPKGLLSVALCFFLTLTVLLFAIPMSYPLIVSINGGVAPVFWPGIRTQSIDPLVETAKLIISHSVPIILGVTIALSVAGRELRDRLGGITRNRYVAPILTVILMVVVYDYLQTLVDYGLNVTTYPEIRSFFLGWLPFNILHSLAPAAVCYIILAYLNPKRPNENQRRVVFFGLLLFATIAMISSFYAYARLWFHYRNMPGMDLVAVVVLLNTTAAIVSFLAAAVVYHGPSTMTEGISVAAGTQKPVSQ